VKVDVASHSPQMDLLRADLAVALRELAPGRCRATMVSTVTGAPLAGDELGADYWVANLRQPVRFGQVVGGLVAEGAAVFVEVSPHPILVPAIEENTLAAAGHAAGRGRALATLRRDTAAERCLKEGLAGLYAAGCDVAWQRLYPTGGQVVELPTYPFQRERYWVDARPPVPGAAPLAVMPSVAPPADGGLGEEPSLLLAQTWERRSPLDAAPLARPAEQATPWLLVCQGMTAGEPEAGAALAAQLRATGARVERVTIGAADHEPAGGFDALLDRVRLAGGGVVVGYGLAASPPLDSDDAVDAALAADATLGCGTVLRLVQALSRTGWRSPPRLFLVTRGAQQVAVAPRAVAVAAAPLWTLGRTLALEHPELRCTRIDLDAAPADAAAETAALLRELLHAGNEDEIALRDGARHVGRLVRQPLAALPPAPAPVAIRPDGAYLVTGGLGGLGLLTARWLAEAGARHLVLLGRTGVANAQQGETLAALAQRGVEVRLVAADLADGAALASALAALPDDLPPLRGVFHAAGALADGVLVNQDPWQFAEVFAAKARGAWNLHRLLRGQPLDCFVLYSSAAVLFGAPGLGNYVAANAFLDALAHHRHGRGLPALSCNWGLFAGIGMGAKALRASHATERGMHAVSSEQGAWYLWRGLRARTAQLGVVAFDARQWLDFHPLAVRSARFGPLLAESRRGRHAKAAPAPLTELLLREASPGERRRRIEQRVRELAAAVLRTDPVRVAPDAPFRSLGLDSVMGLELRNRLEAELGLVLSAALVFIHPTAAALAEHLAAELAPGAAPAEPEAEDALLAAFDASMRQLERNANP
jgi:acyl transferase domain-containing protein/acyl carrier protein